MKSFVVQNQTSVDNTQFSNLGFRYLRRQLGDDVSYTSKSTDHNNSLFNQDLQAAEILPKPNFSMFMPIKRSALTRFSGNLTNIFDLSKIVKFKILNFHFQVYIIKYN